MSNVTLMPSTSTASVGSSFKIGASTAQANLQFTPKTMGFTGTVWIESSTAPNPDALDWFTLAKLVFSAHTTTVAIKIFLSNNPWIRARLDTPTLGGIAVYYAS